MSDICCYIYYCYVVNITSNLYIFTKLVKNKFLDSENKNILLQKLHIE